MKYILLMQFSISSWNQGNTGTWDGESITANIEFLRRFNQELEDSGEFVATEGLGGPEGIKVVRAQRDGTPAVTDGPFPEAKEFLAGYYLIDVASEKRAYEIAARLSSMPGKGGASSNIPIEVRAIMENRSGDW
jgi:hypothetical protein